MPCCCGCFIYLSRFINWFNSRFHKIPWVCKRILILELTSLARFFIQPHVISFNLTLSSYKLQTSLYQTGNHIFSCLAIWNNTLSLIVTNETNQCNNHRVKFICQSYRIKVDFQCREFVYVRKTCRYNSIPRFFSSRAKIAGPCVKVEYCLTFLCTLAIATFVGKKIQLEMWQRLPNGCVFALKHSIQGTISFDARSRA